MISRHWSVSCLILTMYNKIWWQIYWEGQQWVWHIVKGRNMSKDLPCRPTRWLWLSDLFIYFLKVWWHAATLFIYFYINRADIQYFIYILLVEHHFCCPHCFPLGRGPPLGCRAEIRTRACCRASWRATIWATAHPVWATPHPIYLFYFLTTELVIYKLE